ncbi:MAG: methyltransferase family protein [Rhodospirillaceae bacterium]
MSIQVSVETSRKVLSAAGSALLASVWLAFAYRHMSRYGETGELALLLFCISETVQAGLFVVRRTPVSVSTHPLDWIVAVCGTFGAFLFVPVAESASATLGSAMVAAGVALQILGLASLNRSFGIVPANRRVKTNGMYRFVRHPLYASYFILLTGYVIGHLSAWNVAVCLFTLACLVARMWREERLLGADPEYRAYMDRVRYRVLPYVF